MRLPVCRPEPVQISLDNGMRLHYMNREALYSIDPVTARGGPRLPSWVGEIVRRSALRFFRDVVQE